MNKQWRLAGFKGGHEDFKSACPQGGQIFLTLSCLDMSKHFFANFAALHWICLICSISLICHGSKTGEEYSKSDLTRDTKAKRFSSTRQNFIFLLRKPWVKLVLFVVVVICFAQVQSSDSITPRYFASLASSKMWLLSSCLRSKSHNFLSRYLFQKLQTQELNTQHTLGGGKKPIDFQVATLDFQDFQCGAINCLDGGGSFKKGIY